MLALLTRRRTAPSTPDTASGMQPERPDDLAIRFSTVGGSYVDVTGNPGYREDHYRWSCHGCKAYAQFPEKGSLYDMRVGANTHANECRAIPL